MHEIVVIQSDCRKVAVSVMVVANYADRWLCQNLIMAAWNYFVCVCVRAYAHVLILSTIEEIATKTSQILVMI